MSKYTTELRYICETLAGKTSSEGYNSVDEIITTAMPLLFDFDFPIFDEEYRSVLERKIVMHYYRREICAETVGLWKLYLETKLNEIMPYYNELYRTTLIEYNPLYDVDLHRSHTKTGTEQGASTRENATTDASAVTSSGSDSVSETDTATGQNARTVGEEHIDAYSDTPNNKLENLTQFDYLTNIRRNTANDTINDSSNANSSHSKMGTNSSSVNSSRNLNESENNNSSLNTTENYIETLQGSTGSMAYSKKIADFRKNILNIDLQIINELNSLFFGLW